MSKYAIQDIESKLFFVEGSGFIAKTSDLATQFESEDEGYDFIDNVLDLAGLGENAEVVEATVAAPPCSFIQQNDDGSSYATNFVRAKDIVGDGTIRAHRCNPSVRRFKTEGEAHASGQRFTRLEKHAGYYVTKTSDPVNSYVNKITGKVNPIQGRARTDRA